jgi:hypothetical protein
MKANKNNQAERVLTKVCDTVLMMALALIGVVCVLGGIDPDSSAWTFGFIMQKVIGIGALISCQRMISHMVSNGELTIKDMNDKFEDL